MNGLNGFTRLSLLTCALGAAGALPEPAGAQTQPRIVTYLVTMIAASPGGNAVTHESLSLVPAATGSRLQLDGADGSVLSVPAAFTAHGEIAADSQDGAVTCYNMAVDALAESRKPAGARAAVFVRFGNSVVPIPLTVDATQTHGAVRTTALRGTSHGVFHTGEDAIDAGIIIDAQVVEDGGELRGAAFDERHYVKSPDNVIGRSTCTLQRVAPHAVTQT